MVTQNLENVFSATDTAGLIITPGPYTPGSIRTATSLF